MDIPTLDSGPLMLKLGALAVAVIIPDTDSAGAKLRYPLTEVGREITHSTLLLTNKINPSPY